MRGAASSSAAPRGGAHSAPTAAGPSDTPSASSALPPPRSRMPELERALQVLSDTRVERRLPIGLSTDRRPLPVQKPIPGYPTLPKKFVNMDDVESNIQERRAAAADAVAAADVAESASASASAVTAAAGEAATATTSATIARLRATLMGALESFDWAAEAAESLRHAQKEYYADLSPRRTLALHAAVAGAFLRRAEVLLARYAAQERRRNASMVFAADINAARAVAALEADLRRKHSPLRLAMLLEEGVRAAMVRDGLLSPASLSPEAAEEFAGLLAPSQAKRRKGTGQVEEEEEVEEVKDVVVDENPHSQSAAADSYPTASGAAAFLRGSGTLTAAGSKTTTNRRSAAHSRAGDRPSRAAAGVLASSSSSSLSAAAAAAAVEAPDTLTFWSRRGGPRLAGEGRAAGDAALLQRVYGAERGALPTAPQLEATLERTLASNELRLVDPGAEAAVAASAVRRSADGVAISLSGGPHPSSFDSADGGAGGGSSVAFFSSSLAVAPYSVAPQAALLPHPLLAPVPRDPAGPHQAFADSLAPRSDAHTLYLGGGAVGEEFLGGGLASLPAAGAADYGIDGAHLLSVRAAVARSLAAEAGGYTAPASLAALAPRFTMAATLASRRAQGETTAMLESRKMVMTTTGAGHAGGAHEERAEDGHHRPPSSSHSEAHSLAHSFAHSAHHASIGRPGSSATSRVMSASASFGGHSETDGHGHGQLGAGHGATAVRTAMGHTLPLRFLFPADDVIEERLRLAAEGGLAPPMKLRSSSPTSSPTAAAVAAKHHQHQRNRSKRVIDVDAGLPMLQSVELDFATSLSGHHHPPAHASVPAPPAFTSGPSGTPGIVSDVSVALVRVPFEFGPGSTAEFASVSVSMHAEPTSGASAGQADDGGAPRLSGDPGSESAYRSGSVFNSPWTPNLPVLAAAVRSGSGSAAGAGAGAAGGLGKPASAAGGGRKGAAALLHAQSAGGVALGISAGVGGSGVGGGGGPYGPAIMVESSDFSSLTAHSRRHAALGLPGSAGAAAAGAAAAGSSSSPSRPGSAVSRAASAHDGGGGGQAALLPVAAAPLFRSSVVTKAVLASAQPVVAIDTSDVTSRKTRARQTLGRPSTPEGPRQSALRGNWWGKQGYNPHGVMAGTGAAGGGSSSPPSSSTSALLGPVRAAALAGREGVVDASGLALHRMGALESLRLEAGNANAAAERERVAAGRLAGARTVALEGEFGGGAEPSAGGAAPFPPASFSPRSASNAADAAAALGASDGGRAARAAAMQVQTAAWQLLPSDSAAAVRSLAASSVHAFEDGKGGDGSLPWQRTAAVAAAAAAALDARGWHPRVVSSLTRLSHHAVDSASLPLPSSTRVKSLGALGAVRPLPVALSPVRVYQPLSLRRRNAVMDAYVKQRIEAERAVRLAQAAARDAADTRRAALAAGEVLDDPSAGGSPRPDSAGSIRGM